MKKRVLSTVLAVIMLFSTMSFALAEDECCDEHMVIERALGYCPVCKAALSYRTYNVTRNGSGNICYQVVTYGQAYCDQHGNVGGAEELSSMDYYHHWTTDYNTGGVVCTRCGKTGTVTAKNAECPDALAFHHWITNYWNGKAQCTACKTFVTEPLKQEDTICPNHRPFHTWTVDEETGDIICETCGEVGLVIVVE